MAFASKWYRGILNVLFFLNDPCAVERTLTPLTSLSLSVSLSLSLSLSHSFSLSPTQRVLMILPLLFLCVFCQVSGSTEVLHPPCVQAVLDMTDYPPQLVLRAANQLALQRGIPSDAMNDIKAKELLLFCDELIESQGTQSDTDVATSVSTAGLPANPRPRNSNCLQDVMVSKQ